MIELARGKADEFLRGHVCARCYGDLEKVKAEGWDFYKNDTFVIVCPQCGDAWGGTCIRASTAEKMGLEARHAWLFEVKKNLSEFFPEAQESDRRKRVAQNLKELGF